MRSLDELVNHEEPAMPLLRTWLIAARNQHELLACTPEAGEANLLALQVTTRSPLGTMAYQTGGLLIDYGWIRVLGAPSSRLPRGLSDWNNLSGAHRLPGAILVADDVLGGFFALNGGALPGPPGEVMYRAPDTLEWERSELGYTDWLIWALSGDLELFYQGTRWPGWESEVQRIAGDRGILVFPFLSTRGPPVQNRSRGEVPIEELWALHR